METGGRVERPPETYIWQTTARLDQTLKPSLSRDWLSCLLEIVCGLAIGAVKSL